MTRTNLRTLGLAVLFGPMLGLSTAGCESTPAGEVSEAQARRQRMHAENSNAVPVQMFMTVSAPRDVDSDQYADTFPLTIYLFPAAEISALPVWSDGEFRFELRDTQDETLLTEWVFNEESARAARVSRAPGPGYSYFLRLPEGMDSKLGGTGNLYGIFTHKNGLVATSNGAASVRLGNHLRNR